MAEGRVEQAMLAFQSMLVNFPDSRLTGMALYNLGLAYFKRGQFHLAAAEFEKSIKAMPLNDAEFSEKARFCLANSFYLLGRYEEALELFKKTESSPNGEMAMMSGYKAALCYYNMAKDEEALKRLNVLLKKYPEAGLAADIKYWLGERCYAKGDKRGALGNFDEVVSRWPGSPLAGDAHRKMGNLLAEKGDFDSAIGHFKEALADEKVELKAQVQYQIGECFERKNQPEIAVEEYLKVATLYPEGTFWSIRAKLKSAMIFEGLKKAAEARRLYEELAGLDVEESKFAKERLSALQHN
jgi:TolA-binding protein